MLRQAIDPALASASAVANLRNASSAMRARLVRAQRPPRANVPNEADLPLRAAVRGPGPFRSTSDSIPWSFAATKAVEVGCAASVRAAAAARSGPDPGRGDEDGVSVWPNTAQPNAAPMRASAARPSGRLENRRPCKAVPQCQGTAPVRGAWDDCVWLDVTGATAGRQVESGRPGRGECTARG